MTINKATVTNDTTGGSSLIDNGWNNAGGGVGNDKIDGVLYEDPADETAGSKLTIVDGTFTGSYGSVTLTGTQNPSRACVKGDDHSTTVIEGGTYSHAAFPIQNNNVMTINGGTVSDAQIALVRNNNDAANLDADAGQLTINGSTYTGSAEVTDVLANQTGTTKIYGGTFKGTISNGSATGTTTTIFGGMFKTVDGTAAYDVSGYTTGHTSFNSETGLVSVNDVITLTKYVIYQANPGSAHFTYSVSNVNGEADADKVLSKASTSGNTVTEEVRDGVNSGSITVNKEIDFTTDNFNNGKVATEISNLGITDADAQHNYVSSEFSVDFTNVQFDNPGIFRYKLLETNTTTQAVVPASNPLYLDVWVERKGTDPNVPATYNAMQIAAVVAHLNNIPSTVDTSKENYESNKISYLASNSNLQAENLTVKHYSLGNQASRTNDFNYTLTVENATPGAKISWISSDGKTKGEFQIDTDSTKSTVFPFTLKDHAAITFINLPQGSKYTAALVDTSVQATGFKTATMMENYQLATALVDTTKGETATGTIDKLTDETKSGNTYTGGQAITMTNALATNDTTSVTTVTDTELTKNTAVVFSVYKEGTIPTGVIVNVAPYAIVVLAGFFGLIIFAMKRRNSDDEEEA